MNAFIRTLFVSLLLVSVCGCNMEPTYDTPMAVIDGWIDTDGYPVVIFTESLIPNEAGGPIADKIIRWGKVTISDGNRAIILTGGPDHNIMPPYKYVTYNMKGEVGKTYKITADYMNLHAEAECRMLPVTPIKSIELTPIEGNDTLRSGTLKFISPDDCPAYYYITMTDLTDLKKEGRPLPAMMSTYRAETPNKEISIPLFRPKNKLNDDPFIPHLIAGEKWEVKLCRVTKEVYEFWKSYDNMVMFGGSQFINSTQSLHGNIKGGYGVWSVQGTSASIIDVK